jgi:hypothetical protein
LNDSEKRKTLIKKRMRMDEKIKKRAKREILIS